MALSIAQNPDTRPLPSKWLLWQGAEIENQAVDKAGEKYRSSSTQKAQLWLQNPPVWSPQTQCKRNIPLLSPSKSYTACLNVKQNGPFVGATFKELVTQELPLVGCSVPGKLVDKVSEKPVQIAAPCFFPLLLKFQLIRFDLIFHNCAVRFYSNLPPVFHQLAHPCISDGSASDLTRLPCSLVSPSSAPKTLWVAARSWAFFPSNSRPACEKPFAITRLLPWNVSTCRRVLLNHPCALSAILFPCDS